MCVLVKGTDVVRAGAQTDSISFVGRPAELVEVPRLDFVGGGVIARVGDQFGVDDPGRYLLPLTNLDPEPQHLDCEETDKQACRGEGQREKNEAAESFAGLVHDADSVGAGQIVQGTPPHALQ